LDDFVFEYHLLLKTKKLFIRYIYNFDHFCALTGTNPRKLYLFLKKEEIGYSTFSLPKKTGGFRKIDAPTFELKYLQRWILDQILQRLDPGPFAHGFVKDRSIASNAAIHTNQ
jgi:retron-type reverse transcriptase